MSQQHGHIKNLLEEIVSRQISTESLNWLKEKGADTGQFQKAFASVPGKTGKKIISITAQQTGDLALLRPGWIVSGWPIDRLARVWLLLLPDHADTRFYHTLIEDLFHTAEVNELVALYSALPVLYYPVQWKGRCAEGVRSNIGHVLTAIMCHNPYPSENLEEAAWNQMVLKAFFTEKPVELILGIDTRVNERLAGILSDYAHERWAAHRSVNPQLWRCVGPFVNEYLFADILKLLDTGLDTDLEAAMLACAQSHYPPARELLDKHEPHGHEIASGILTWNRLAKKMSDYVLQQ